MKRTLLFCLVLGVVSSYALDPAQVASDEDFSVQEVVERLDPHMINVQQWYETAKRCASEADYLDLMHKVPTRAYSFDIVLLKSVVEVIHPVMISCFKDMEEQKSLEPFFIVWNTFKYAYDQNKDDQLLCKEVAFLAMHLYSTMLGQLQRSGTRVSVSQMLELYHIIAALPIYELLALLDSIATEIIGLLDQTYHGENSFFVWLWHNWWVPPTVISHAVASLVEGIATIMIAEKPVEADAQKEAAQKSLNLCANLH